MQVTAEEALLDQTVYLLRSDVRSTEPHEALGWPMFSTTRLSADC
jgi:hypothetical protein